MERFYDENGFSMKWVTDLILTLICFTLLLAMLLTAFNGFSEPHTYLFNSHDSAYISWLITVQSGKCVSIHCFTGWFKHLGSIGCGLLYLGVCK
jgi:hypothetical protein